MNGDGPVPVSLDSVLCTEELQRRPSRPANYRAENRALLALMQELASVPNNVLQKLAETALELYHGHSAGISLLESPGPPGHWSASGDHFRWYAVAGRWALLIWNTTTPRDDGPCGTVLDRNRTLLFSRAKRYFTQFADVEPQLTEALLVPFYVDGEAVGTLWVVAHDESKKFDAEDQRVLENLSTLASTHTAFDGLEAVAAAEEFRPDVVLLDIGLPKLNGYETAITIREQPWGKEMLLVAVTGWGQDDDREKSRNAGFDAHMLKPVDHTVLSKLLAESLPNSG